MLLSSVSCRYVVNRENVCGVKHMRIILCLFSFVRLKQLYQTLKKYVVYAINVIKLIKKTEDCYFEDDPSGFQELSLQKDMAT